MNPLTEEALLQATKDLVAIESTADNPEGLRAAYEYIRRMLWDSGKSIALEEFESNGKPSLLAYREGARPDSFHIILNGHVDVVPGKPEQYKPAIKDGKLYGRGAYDMKAAAIIMAQVFCEFVDVVPYALALQIVTSEEDGGSDGTLLQIQHGVRGNLVICGECGRSVGTHEIANEAKGVALLEVGFQGTSAHGAYPRRGNNAALKAARFSHLLHERYPTPTEATSETTVTVISISATSDAHSKTSDRASVKIDARYIPGDPDFQTRAHIAALLAQIDPDAEILRFQDFSRPIYTHPDHPTLVKLKASAEKVEDHNFALVRRNGTSDGRYYGEVGNSACEFGIVGEHQHGDDEYITLEAFHDYLQVMRDFLESTVATADING